VALGSSGAPPVSLGKPTSLQREGSTPQGAPSWRCGNRQRRNPCPPDSHFATAWICSRPVVSKRTSPVPTKLFRWRVIRVRGSPAPRDRVERGSRGCNGRCLIAWLNPRPDRNGCLELLLGDAGLVGIVWQDFGVEHVFDPMCYVRTYWARYRASILQWLERGRRIAVDIAKSVASLTCQSPASGFRTPPCARLQGAVEGLRAVRM
jgi:hypothetical protein